MTSRPVIPDSLEKTMSASLGEFQRSMAVLLPKHGDGQSYVLESDNGTITITYEALPPVKLSALVAMPRGRVTILFSGVPQSTRASFIDRFDLAFRRGGG